MFNLHGVCSASQKGNGLPDIFMQKRGNPSWNRHVHVAQSNSSSFTGEIGTGLVLKVTVASAMR